ncbi:Type III secretion thermoregulatory protein (LcrF,VirF) [Pseudomonas chlororaphis subsp. piscium]|nr:Type III secretion thermoregulatory protein (LcrF,VirF) [Pseudomonas chlororaphis subsp. piscium]
MRTNEDPERGVPLSRWCSSARPGEQLVRIRNGSRSLCLSHRQSSVQWCFAPEWQGLLMLCPGMQVVSGDACVLPLSGANLVKLQFFIDQGVAPAAGPARAEPWVSLREECTRKLTASGLESWYLTLALRGCNAYQAFARQLRSSESYQLLAFLLERGCGGEKLQDLAGRYGVSISHFRRLCRQALGGGAKSELREWRTAKALLSMADGVVSLTDVALEFGYSSSSHFSKEIRELVGVAPSSLTDIARLSSE